MVLRVVPASEADAPRAAAIEAAAYGSNPLSRVLFPGPFAADAPTRAERLAEQLRTDPACRWAKVEDTALAEAGAGSEATVAFSQWFVWEGAPENRPLVWGAGADEGMCDAFFGAMRRAWWQRYEGRPHVYLKLMHTDPGHQRRGAAGMLLDWGLAEADRLGVEAYLEASEAGRGLYAKYGFEEVGRHRVDLSGHGEAEDATAVMMVRPVMKRVEVEKEMSRE